jgi:hypothetical protein
MNVRVLKLKKGHTEIDNRLLNDPEISFQAKGLICYLLSKTNDWKAIAEQLANVGPDGMGVVRSALKELQEHGYARRLRIVDGQTKRVIAWELAVFESKEQGMQLSDGACIDESRLRILQSGSSTIEISTCKISRCGKLQATKDYIVRKTDSTKESNSFQELDRPASADLDLDECGLTPEEIQAAGEAEDQSDGGSSAAPAAVAAPAQTDLCLKAEDETTKDFPWRQIMAAMKRLCPDLTLPTKGEKRDAAMKKFWRDRGKTISCFELLAEKVAASDYLMARNGHTGIQGRRATWSWIFSKNPQGVMRADAILDGRYSNESMAFVLEKESKVKLTKVMRVGSHEPIEVNLAELWEGEPRYKVCGEHLASGLPEVLDYKS